MALSEYHIDLIAKYISNTLGDTERNAFDKALEQKEFRKELLLQVRATDALEASVNQQLKQRLKALDASEELTKGRHRFLFEPIIKYAAVLLLLIGAFFLFKQFNNTPDANSLMLISQYNTVYPAEIVQRGEASEMTPAYKQAMSQYANQNYKEALISFRNIVPQTDKIVLYRLNCLIELEQFNQADDLLKANKNILLKRKSIAENTEWYEAIILLGKGQTKSAKEKLEQIQNQPDHLFNLKATQLLGAL